MCKSTRIPALMLAALLAMSTVVTPAAAMTYSVEGADGGFFATSTSVDVEVPAADSASDYSKNAAYAPPGFGTAESYLPNRAEQLINLKGTDGYDSGIVVGPGSIPTGNTSDVTIVNGFPAVDGGTTSSSSSNSGYTTSSSAIQFTPVTSSSYYKNGTLGTIKIPAIGINFSIYEGTTSDDMKYGAGHFSSTSIWNGNVCLAAHNRGVSNNFGKIHTLKSGDTITLTTVYGTRTYSVYSVQKVSENDVSCLDDTADNIITLVTCVANEKPYRYVVKGYQV